MQSNYETLRSWYLAKLRKSAIEAQVSGQLTPSALIAADREVIEKLIAERSESEEGKGSKRKRTRPSGFAFALYLWLYLISAALFSLFLFCLADPAILFDVVKVSVNPVNLAASGRSLPVPLVMITVQAVVFVYPLTVFPYVLFSNKTDE